MSAISGRRGLAHRPQQADDQQAERARRRTLEEAARRGLTVTPQGQAWRIHGAGVDLVIADLALVGVVDLTPTGGDA